MHIFHKWTKWSEPKIMSVRRKFADPNLREFSCDWIYQERSCVKCNLIQRRKVKHIYEAGADFSD
jgi:hypothetical protein